MTVGELLIGRCPRSSSFMVLFLSFSSFLHSTLSSLLIHHAAWTCSRSGHLRCYSYSCPAHCSQQ